MYIIYKKETFIHTSHAIIASVWLVHRVEIKIYSTKQSCTELKYCFM